MWSSPEIIAAFIAGFFSLAAVVLAGVANWNVRSLKAEFQLGLLRDRLKAYQSLWASLEVVAPSVKDSLTEVARDNLEKSLRAWYFNQGNGIFLSASSQEQFLHARQVLRGEKLPSTDKAVRDAFSELRTRLKNDIKVYGRAEKKRKLGEITGAAVPDRSADI
jgi:hypothetical protein